jgi:guanosine-3',5'-bis(diphosphate) 3'-pyrophosphohydrolase
MSVVLLAELKESVEHNSPGADVDQIERAFHFADKHHGEQIRASGERYITHPLAVASILASKRLDGASVVTALLHDTVEDTSVTLKEVTAHFGQEVARLVDGVTKLTKLELRADQSKQAENFRKLVVSMAQDIRVLLIKLADRLHNMRTLSYIKSPEKRQRIALETMEIYAPLAERIGMQDWRDELTDLAFAELHTEARQSVIARLDYLRANSYQLVDRVIVDLRALLREQGIQAEIFGREKLPHSIWEKMKKKNVPFEQITDIMAFRIIVDNITDCYQTLGCIHSKYRAVVGRFKDYISVPKANGYRSLHTTVMAPNRLRIEVQIRTRNMHDVAEYGVAAHWLYKDGGGDESEKISGQQFSWMRGLVDMLDETTSSDEFLEQTKLEMFSDQVFCFTPKGQLISLPQGATAVDFAYAVHSDVGDTCVGAKVNGKLVPLRSILQNGDQVLISTSKNRSPSAEWLRFVVTGKAQARVRRTIRLQQREQYIQLGHEIVRNMFSAHQTELSERALGPALEHFDLNDSDDLYAALGEGQINEHELLARLYPSVLSSNGNVNGEANVVAFLPSRRQRAEKKLPVAIRGLIPGLALHYARCCHPLPGDEIVGIVTSGKGVTIHSNECASLESFRTTPERWLDVSWDPEASSSNTARLRVTGENRPGQLADTSATIAQNLGNITNLRFTHRAEDFCEMEIDIQVIDVAHLNNIIAALRAQPSVATVDRARS